MPLNDGATNDILLFAPNGTEEAGDLMSLETYLSHAQRLRGHQQGMALRELENKVLRQTSLMAAGVAQFIANRYAAGVRDNADVDAVEDGLATSIEAMISAMIGAIDIPAAPDLTGYARFAVSQSWSAAQRSTPVQLSSLAAPNFSTSNVMYVTLTSSGILMTPVEVACPGQSGAIWITQDSAGGHTLGFNAFWKFEDGIIPSINTAPLARSLFIYEIDPSAGTAVAAVITGF